MLRQLRNNEAHNLNFIRLYLWFNLCRQFLVLCSEVLLMFCSSSATLCLSAYNQFLKSTFLSPQAKRWAIITDKHGVYKLPHELPNNLRLRILGN